MRRRASLLVSTPLAALVLGLALGVAACSDAPVTPGPTDAAATALDAEPADAAAGPADADADADAEPADAGALAPDARAPNDAAEPLPDAAVAPEAWAPFAVLSLNLHCLRLDGTPYPSNAERFAAIARVAASEGVAVILAQEVCVRTGESAETELRGALETATSTTWSSHWMFAHDAWAGTPDAAREGLAVFARGRDAITAFTDVPHRAQGSLRRVMVVAKLAEALGGLTVHSVHLDHAIASVRERQAAEAATWSIAAAEPSLDLLVAGDFNAGPGSPPPSKLTAMGFVDVAAPLGLNRIDHVLLHRGARATATSQRFAFDGAHEPAVSDHPGVVVHLAPAAAPVVQPTRLLAHAPWSGMMFVRGDASPLDWATGWPALPLGQGDWKLVLTELVADGFEYKWLRDDTTWQTGDNERGVRGELRSTTPQF